MEKMRKRKKMKVKDAETYIRTKVEGKKVNQGQKKENDNDGKMRKEKDGGNKRRWGKKRSEGKSEVILYNDHLLAL